MDCDATLSPKVNLHHAITFKALCGAKLVTHPADFRGNDTCVAHGADPKTCLVFADSACALNFLATVTR